MIGVNQTWKSAAARQPTASSRRSKITNTPLPKPTHDKKALEIHYPQIPAASGGETFPGLVSILQNLNLVLYWSL